MLVVAILIFLCSRRKAAVGTLVYFFFSATDFIFSSQGRVELRAFLIVYFVTLPVQIITNGSLLPQGSTAIVVFTAIHAGLVVALFWILIANAVVATQWIEDGTMSSIVVRGIFNPQLVAILTVVLFTATINYLSYSFRWHPVHFTRCCPWGN